MLVAYCVCESVCVGRGGEGVPLQVKLKLLLGQIHLIGVKGNKYLEIYTYTVVLGNSNIEETNHHKQ